MLKKKRKEKKKIIRTTTHKYLQRDTFEVTRYGRKVERSDTIKRWRRLLKIVGSTMYMKTSTLNLTQVYMACVQGSV